VRKVLLTMPTMRVSPVLAPGRSVIGRPALAENQPSSVSRGKEKLRRMVTLMEMVQRHVVRLLKRPKLVKVKVKVRLLVSNVGLNDQESS
jgi:hypothetical protein